MRVKECIEEKYVEMELHVCNNMMNEQVKDMVRELNELVNGVINGTDRKGDRCILKVHDIFRFYSEGQKVMAQGEDGVYSVSEKLYELENKLDANQFIRISKSEIVNIRKIKKLDISMAGTIKLFLTDGTQTYTSRRNVSKLKSVLGIGKRGE